MPRYAECLETVEREAREESTERDPGKYVQGTPSAQKACFSHVFSSFEFIRCCEHEYPAYGNGFAFSIFEMGQKANIKGECEIAVEGFCNFV